MPVPSSDRLHFVVFLTVYPNAGCRAAVNLERHAVAKNVGEIAEATAPTTNAPGHIPEKLASRRNDAGRI